MSKLDPFLNPTSLAEEVKEIVVSERFLDENKKPATIKIKTLNQLENDAILKKCRIKEKQTNGVINERIDYLKYQDELILASIVEPNFRSEKFTLAMGVVDPIEGVKKLFTPTEYLKLVEAVTGNVTDYNNGGEIAKN